MQPQFAIALVGVAIANIDAAAIDFNRADEYCARANFVGIEMRIGLHTIKRFERHAIGVTRPNQEIAEVSGVVRIG